MINDAAVLLPMLMVSVKNTVAKEL
ncbi:hypothetical protein KL86CLO1_12142 [uncultured Eubacteriales bacterium]|uniref:Uncharacterized protein n=1 Tax=uncultured Eubacteriales bacterium TaxID=172733 RepID=A0A212K3V5_9FIRM|nr:hypothetical protein KL86CLO1_12142 [uncultured Eubacteriales bacterium]